MLLNEVQKQHKEIVGLKDEVSALKEQNKELSALKEQIRELSAIVERNTGSSARLSRLEAELDR